MTNRNIPHYNFNNNMRIYNIGDIHRGNKNFNHDLLCRIVKEVANDKRALWVSTGDLLEVAIMGSKSSAYTGMNLDDEFEALCEELNPISKKCLGLVESNHHRRVSKSIGMSLDKRIASELQIPFLGITGVINVTCGRASYFMCLHHGVGGGTAGNKVNRARKLSQIQGGCDIYFSGHTHSYSHVPFRTRFVDRKRNLIREHTAHHVVTGHFIDYGESYAEEILLEPMPKGVAFVDIKACKAGNFINKRVVPGFFE